MDTNEKIPIPPAAQDLQLQYARQVLQLRGEVPGNVAAEPDGKTFRLKQRSVFVNEAAEVEGEFRSPPLAAYVDDGAPDANHPDRAIPSVPMEVRTTPGHKPDTFRVSLVAGRSTKGGKVRLVWPTKTLDSERATLAIAGDRLDVEVCEVDEGIIALGLAEPPTEIWLGSRQAECVAYRNGVALVRVGDASGAVGPLLVITPTRVYRTGGDVTLMQLVEAPLERQLG